MKNDKLKKERKFIITKGIGLKNNKRRQSPELRRCNKGTKKEQNNLVLKTNEQLKDI